MSFRWDVHLNADAWSALHRGEFDQRALVKICTGALPRQRAAGTISPEGMLALWPPVSGPLGSNFELWQLVTYSFLHGNTAHIFFNMFGLWVFGGMVEQYLGSKRYACPAHREQQLSKARPEQWLLIEWPEGESEPSKYWLATVGEDISFEELVDRAKMRWRIERDYQDLKQELGLGRL